MKVALAQMEVVPGLPEKNLETMLSMIDKAKKEKADLVVFPEMCVGGYLLSDKWLEDEFNNDLMARNEDILKASMGIAIAYGNVFVEGEKDGFHPNKDGRSRKYNAVYVIQNGKPALRIKPNKILPEGVQPKTLLPNYRIFDDERYFFSLQDVSKDFGVKLEDLLSPFAIEVNGKMIPIGFELCEDLWCEDYRKDGAALNATKLLVRNGAKYIVNLSASPWTFGKNAARDRRVKFIKSEIGEKNVPFFYVNCVGAQNNGKNIVTFDGGSTVYNKDGLPVILAQDAYEQRLIVVNDSDLEGRVLDRREKSKIAQKYEAIIRGIQHVKDMNGTDSQPKYVIGLSGGIDSNLVASLLVKAVGKDRVLGINMPSRFNSDKTKRAAKTVAERLGIGYEVIPIEELAELNANLLDSIDADGKGTKLSSLNRENIQAKIRGTSILSNIGAKYNALFTNNGNKLEVALGYATLYGDWGGALAPIADLTKTEVVEMAKYINEIYGEEIIPKDVIPDSLWRFTKDQIQPSAELKNDQVDPMKFGYHCAVLEAVTDYKRKTPAQFLRWYLDGKLAENLGISNELLVRWGIDNPHEFVSDLEWFTSKIQNNVFKRVQAPPIIITSKSAYGYDHRESILPFTQSKEYQDLKKKVLQMAKYLPRGEK